MTMYVRATAPISLSVTDDLGSDFRLDQQSSKVLPLWVTREPGFQRLWSDNKVQVATDSAFNHVVITVPDSELFGVSSVNGHSGDVTLTKSDVGLGNSDNTADSTKVVFSAAKLTTARTINGVSFDGSADITISGSGATITDNSDGTASSSS